MREIRKHVGGARTAPVAGGPVESVRLNAGKGSVMPHRHHRANSPGVDGLEKNMSLWIGPDATG